MFGGIDAKTMENLAGIVDNYVQHGLTNITLNISSNGGELEPAIAAYEYLKGRPINLTTHNFGNVDSSAVILFAAGTQRLCTPLGRFVIHDPASVIQIPGEMDEAHLNERVATLKQGAETMAKILAEVTGKPTTIVRGWMKDRVVWTAEQALDNKLATSIKDEVKVSTNVASIVGPLTTPNASESEVLR
jgi:ATP-dependent Clp protease protease subunit